MTSGIMETSQYLTCKLGQEIYALDISKVREVLDFTAATKVPRTPDFMRGVINLRGSVVPVVDLKLKLGMPMTEKAINTCIIISEITADGETAIIGALADSVQEVLDLESGHISPPPKFGLGVNTEFMKGIGRRNDQFIIIIDLDKVFSSRELAIVQETQSADVALPA